MVIFREMLAFCECPRRMFSSISFVFRFMSNPFPPMSSSDILHSSVRYILSSATERSPFRHQILQDVRLNVINTCYCWSLFSSFCFRVLFLLSLDFKLNLLFALRKTSSFKLCPTHSSTKPSPTVTLSSTFFIVSLLSTGVAVILPSPLFVVSQESFSFPHLLMSFWSCTRRQ